ncbi:MAG: malto-oligosyltrehalose trehalohydrolase [Candidatus Acidiferrales bacterium]
MQLGANWLGSGRCEFCVWAPAAQRVEVRLVSPSDRVLPLGRDERGYHSGIAESVQQGALYLYRLDGERERPDPASRFQPQGIHGPSQIIDPAAYAWSDSGWAGMPLEDYVLYDFHVGAFTAEGTFDAVIPQLDDLKELGITAVELMPVAQFPGSRNWGYDGAYPYAVQDSYGGPEGLKRLVDACHTRGLAVVLDVVYNHLGPEGNYFGDFGPYFTDCYHTPWGRAINFDGPESDEVRRYFIENALYWITEFHIDALRLDAIHGICDFSTVPFQAELADAVHNRAEELGRHIYVIPESDRNDSTVVRARAAGGLGQDALWNDDFHHAIHALLTGERNGYYRDFGKVEHLAKALREGFVYSGQYSAYRRRRHGNSSADLPARQFVVFGQNHDQVGNRMGGERLSQLVSFEALKVAAGIVLLSPYLPLLFMKEEYGETAPFLYFISHSDPGLIEAVRQGRRREFAAFAWPAAAGEPPDPQDESTFERCKLNRELRRQPGHRQLLEFHRQLLRLRKTHPTLSHGTKDRSKAKADEDKRVLALWRGSGNQRIVAAFNFARGPVTITPEVPAGRWRKLLDSAAVQWNGPGTSLPDEINSTGQVSLALNPESFALFASAEN